VLAVVGGDARSQSIAAASIVAKVLRDRLMRAWHRAYPAYGFDSNVGYPTPYHLRALREHGACPLHRVSFAPVRATAAQRLLPL
jgi:ribonuclease HII